MKVATLVHSILVLCSLNCFSASEPLGPSSRRTPIAISEIMYKPATRTDLLNAEFVELYNSNPWPEDISGYRLSGDIDFTFPPATSIGARGFVVVAAVPADVQSIYGLANVFGPYTNGLKSSGTIRLLDEQGSRLLGIEYDDAMPWPMGADGTGHSIVLARASYGENDPRAWDRSRVVGGSPGADEPPQTNALDNVVINEILAHTDPPDVDSIELYNHSNVSVSLVGCTLSDDPTTNKFKLSGGIPPKSFVYFTEAQLGFRLNAAGQTIYFRRGGTNVIDAVKIGAQENGVSFGRYPNGSSDWWRLAAKTFGKTNAAPLACMVGFNEIMYRPISGDDDDQYVELFNRGTNAINLGGWKVGGGISFTFRTNQVLAPQGYLVVSRNMAQLISHYSQLNETNTVGNFGGKLSGSGERLTLTMPDTTLSTNAVGVIVTNYLDIVVDEVTYGTGGRWGRWSDGGGSSLELIDPRSDKRRAANWADSDETAKAPWTTIEATGVLDNGSGSFSPLQIGLLDAGECLVDDVEAVNASDVNCAGNGSFENGMNSISFVGNHSRSSLETNSGYAGSVALHVRTADALMTGPNAVQIALANTSFSAGQTATLRFKARWLHGSREPLLRFWGCYLEAAGLLPVPANLGTPGLPNSRALTNAGPAIYEVRHDPAVPATNQPVVVTARVSDPDRITSLTVSYRFDPLTTRTNLPMNDAGTNGDAVAGDGIYSATLPARMTNAIAFTVLATDGLGATNRFPELVPDNAPDRECVVFFGDPNPTNLFGTYHLWLTQTNVARWISLPKMSNEDIDGTLVYNNRVIYNMGGRYAGGPFHQYYNSPVGPNACHYVWTMPEDDLLLGTSSFNQIHWPGNDIQSEGGTSDIDDATLQREQAAYMFLRGLGQPWMYRRFVALYVNGVRRSKFMEDACRPTAGVVSDQYLAGDSGQELVKIQRWYEGSSASLISDCRLQNFTTTDGAKKTARYRPNWALKDSPGSLSDYTNIYTLITAANAYNDSNYVKIVENVADMENWMRFSVANHAAGNWDCFGSTSSGQNADAWVSAQHPWTLFQVDFSICLDNRLSFGGLFGMFDPAWQRMFNTPKFGRMYYRALNELANGVMRSDVINPVLDAKYAAFLAAGQNPSSPANTKSWIASRRSTILSSLTGINSTVFALGTNLFNATSNTVTLSGTAPVEILTINIDGINYTPVWTTLTNWSLTVPAAFGTNTWTVQAFDRNGNIVGSSFPVSVENTTEPEPPAGNVVFNEIMFNAPAPGAEYIELFNRATNTTFDLSGWTINGLGYTFPPGSVLQPQSYLVLAKSSVVFAATYGALIPVFGTFDGNLQSDGETLSLIKPGVAPEPDLVVDRVRYEPDSPWPATPALVPGTALQLVDANQDNSRVVNWSSSDFVPNTPGSANSVVGALPEFPPLWLNEVQVENLTGPTDNFGQREPWVELHNSGTNVISLDGFYLGTNYSSSMQWAFPADTIIAPGQFLVVWLDGQPEQNSSSALHTDFRLSPGPSTLALSRFMDGLPQIVDYLNFTSLPANYSYGDVPDGQPFYRQAMFHSTPAGTNNAALPAITVSINEWMAENAGYLFNPGTGKNNDDWFELYNPSNTPAELGGYFLTDNLTNAFQFQIPSGYRVPANGFLLVWADGKTSANSTNNPDLHVPFKLNKDGEELGLFTPEGEAIDAVEFGPQSANISEGRFRDGQPLRLFMPTPSPLLPNVLPPALTPPSFTGFLLQADQSLGITFQTSPGHTYRVEFKTDLSDPSWQPLGADHFATEASLSVSDNISGPQRFYRIRMVE